MNRTFQLALAGLLLTGAVAAQTAAPAAATANAARPAQNFDNVQVHVLPVQGNVYMLVGAGGNIAVQVGKEGVLLGARTRLVTTRRHV